MEFKEQEHYEKDVMVEVFRKMIKNLNIMGFEKENHEALAFTLRDSHRTLQANFWRMIQEVAKDYATLGTDARNEKAVEFAKEINKINIYIPFI